MSQESHSALQRILREFRDGTADEATTINKLERRIGFSEIELGKFDTSREQRTGVPEAILAEGKPTSAICQAFDEAVKANEQLIATRASDELIAALRERHPHLHIHEEARIVAAKPPTPDTSRPNVIVVSAGSLDRPVAFEAEQTSLLFGNPTTHLLDVGVAGLHRLLKNLDKFEDADVIIVVAGMDGALPSVLAGLMHQPIIAVPTSVGYGASFGGVAALLTMLNSCAPGVVVSNIDNGFGAAATATKICQQIMRRER